MAKIDFDNLETSGTQEYMAFGVEQMHQLGFDLGRYFSLPAVVNLRGDLGAGKTTLVQGLAKFYGYLDVVSSPTYNLIHEYPCESAQIAHLDLYRLEDPEEMEMLGLADLLTDESMLLIEWPEKGGARLPEAQYDITIAIVFDAGKSGRKITVSRIN